MKKNKIKMMSVVDVFDILLCILCILLCIYCGYRTGMKIGILMSLYFLYTLIKCYVPMIISIWKSRLKNTGECIRLPIIAIEASSKLILRRQTAQYVVVGSMESKEDISNNYSGYGGQNHAYKSPEVFYDLYSVFNKGDILSVYIDPANPNRYFVDLNS